jgi:hypothetical protein
MTILDILGIIPFWNKPWQTTCVCSKEDFLPALLDCLKQKKIWIDWILELYRMPLHCRHLKHRCLIYYQDKQDMTRKICALWFSVFYFKFCEVDSLDIFQSQFEEIADWQSEIGAKFVPAKYYDLLGNTNCRFWCTGKTKLILNHWLFSGKIFAI